MKKGSILWGIFLIAIGVLFLINRFFNLNLLSAARLWPLIILSLGLIFEASYFLNRKDPGILVPGGILTTIGALFLFETMTGWRFSANTWPVYPLAVAIGLFQLYLFGGQNKGLLIPVAILAGVSLTAFSVMAFGQVMSTLLLPLGLILLGAYIIFKGLKK